MAKENSNEEEETAPAEEEDSEENADASEDDDAPEEEEEGAEEESEDAEDEHIDWEEIAKEEKDKRKKAEKKLAGKRFKGKRSESEDDEGDDEDEKPLTRSEVSRMREQIRSDARKEANAERAVDLSERLTDTPEEADAVHAIWENRTWSEDVSLKQQIEEAYYIAHGPRLLAKLKELRRSNRSKQDRSHSSAENSHPDGSRPADPEASAADKSEYARLGYTWNGKHYVKKLEDGRTLMLDPKSKKKVIAK